MHRLSPADELAAIRAEIARLKRREAELRQAILHDPDCATTGRWHRIEVTVSRARVFDAQLLPAAIRGDPRYRRERVTTYVRCLPVEVCAPAPPPGRTGLRHMEGAMH